MTRLKLILLESDYGKDRKLIKKHISTEREALELFRSILQTYWGIPDKEILKRFVEPVGFENGGRRKGRT